MSSQRLLSYAIPCYNSAAYMDHCIEMLLESGADNLDEIEIIIVDDGSAGDDTAEKADEWERRHPGVIRTMHQENGGHGQAVNTGLQHATGLYFKVVDSDDWLDIDAARKMIDTLRGFAALDSAVDLVIANYVYEHVETDERTVIRYKGVLPEERIFGWDDVGTFNPSQNLLMHAVIYRTELLRDCRLELPRHTFYVDNIFVYVPLPSVRTLYYENVDLYRYFIGREDQSVNESVMIKRIDQQLRITRIMIDAFDLSTDIDNKRLQRYMISYLTMMMTICSIFTTLSDDPEAADKRTAIWAYLKERNTKVYPRIRYGVMGMGSNLPGRLGRRTSLGFYHVAQRLFKFN